MTPIFNTNQNYPMIHIWCNLVNLAQNCDELSCGQSKVYGRTDGETDGRTDAGNDNNLRPASGGLDLFNDDTRPSGHISRPAQVNVSQSCFHSLNTYSSLIILYTSGG